MLVIQRGLGVSGRKQHLVHHRRRLWRVEVLGGVLLVLLFLCEPLELVHPPPPCDHLVVPGDELLEINTVVVVCVRFLEALLERLCIQVLRAAMLAEDVSQEWPELLEGDCATAIAVVPSKYFHGQLPLILRLSHKPVGLLVLELDLLLDLGLCGLPTRGRLDLLGVFTMLQCSQLVFCDLGIELIQHLCNLEHGPTQTNGRG